MFDEYCSQVGSSRAEELMKPCYRRGNEFYLLAHVIRQGDQFLQPCKALITPGDCPAITQATGEFLQSCGWLAPNTAPPKHSSEKTILDRADSGADQLVHCGLVVAKCQVSTVLQVVEDAEVADECAFLRWHIHIGKKEFEDLERKCWGLDICYLPATVEEGQSGSRPDCQLRCREFTDAFQNGHPDCLKYVHLEYPWHRQNWPDQRFSTHYSRNAAFMPTAEALMYLHDVLGLPWTADTCAAAAECDSMDCLSYAHVSGCPWNANTCAIAARFGRLQCLVYAHEHGCAWDTGTLHAAARSGHWECLKYAHTNGCPYNADQPFKLWHRTPSYLTCEAVRASSMPCLVYVHEALGCSWDPEGLECKLASQRGDLELLEYIHSHGGILCTHFELFCPNSETWLHAAGNFSHRNLSKAMCLVYVHRHGGCQVKGIWLTEIGKLALETIQARRVAVMLCFYAGRAQGGEPLIAAAHDAMQRMPS